MVGILMHIFIVLRLPYISETSEHFWDFFTFLRILYILWIFVPRARDLWLLALFLLKLSTNRLDDGQSRWWQLTGTYTRTGEFFFGLTKSYNNLTSIFGEESKRVRTDTKSVNLKGKYSYFFQFSFLFMTKLSLNTKKKFTITILVKRHS